MLVQDRLFVGGEWVPPATGATIDVVSPYTERVVARVPGAAAADVDQAVAAARAAFDGGPWPRTPPDERADVLQQAAALLYERRAEIADLITLEMGSPTLFSQFVQAPAPVRTLRAYARLAREFPFQEERGNRARSLLVHEPVGVVAAIVPWNTPLLVTMSKVAPALAAGCTVVVKPAPEAPLDANVMAEAFAAAGLPPGVLSVLPAGREVGEHLVRHPGVDKVAFTGSTAAGRRIAALCGERLARVSLELVRAGGPAALPGDEVDRGARGAAEGARMSDHDLVIRGGTVVDGTGGPARTADVAITAGVVTEVGRVSGTAHRTIDADGLVVTPGFVDIHAHYDGQATWAERMTPSSWHGVTTVLAGNCGVGFAPVRPADHGRLIELMEGVEDIPGTVLSEGLSWDWRSFPEFLDVLDGRRFDIDVATQVPHGALRLHVMGERGAAREAATADDIAAMATLAAEAVEAGALGFSTSRTLNHRTSRGEPTPTLTAGADELVGIARAIGATGRGVLQVVSDFTDLEGEFALFRRMAEESGRPLSFSLTQVHGDGWRRQLDLLTQANADGVAMAAQVAPRPIGVLLGLQCTLHPFVTNPVVRGVADRPLAERVRVMADPAVRERVLATERAARDERAASGRPGRLIHALDRMYELGDPPDYEPDPATSVSARAARDGVDPLDLSYDLMLGDGGRAFLYLPLLNYADGDLDAAGEMLAHPHTVVGLADGGAHVGSICDASFPTTLLSHWGRDRERGRMGLPFLVHRQTQATARTVGLLDRGVLAPGYRADVNVIDAGALVARRPQMRHDLPAGGKRLVQGADGYVATLVAGEVTYEHGEEAGPLPGRLVRGPQPAAATTPPGGTR